MNHNHNVRHEDDTKHSAHCVCGSECLGCKAESLSVSCGCKMEAKQYEYDVAEAIGHPEHADVETVKAAEKTIYTCPMHSQVKKSEPGRCPACGMELIPVSAKPARPESGGTGAIWITRRP